MTFEELVQRAQQFLEGLALERPIDGRVAPELSARTVRFLRQADIVSRPTGVGPAAIWSKLHLEQILTARALQAAGHTLSECANLMRGLDEAHLTTLRNEAISNRPPSPPPPPTPICPPCPAWQITPDFALVSTRGATLSCRQLTEIQHIITRQSHETSH